MMDIVLLAKKLLIIRKYKMKRSRIICAVLAGLTVFCGSMAVASNNAGDVTITPGLGYDFFAGKRNLHNTVVIPQLAVAYNFTDKWAIEAAYGRLNTSYNYSVGGSVDGNLYTVDGLYRFTLCPRLQPYVSAGLGVLYLNPNGTDATNQTNINAGVGAQLFMGHSVALRTEVRDLYTMSGGKNDVLLNLGVSFLF